MYSNNKMPWYHPYNNRGELDFVCDDLGEAQEVMEKLWLQLCKFNPEFPKEGWIMEDDTDV